MSNRTPNERQSDVSSSADTVRGTQRNNCLSRFILVWFQSSAAAEATRWRNTTNRVCFKNNIGTNNDMPKLREVLATTWACVRYSDFLVSKTFHIQTDHKPLVSLLGKKTLGELPPRTQRIRMRLMRFGYSISHVPRKDLVTADTLSRAPVMESIQPDDKTTAKRMLTQSLVNSQ